MINYFGTQSNLSKFQFQFDPDRFVPTAAQLNTALKGKKSLLKSENWANYKSMFGFSDIEVPINDFDKLIDFITSNKFNSLINPI